MQYNFINPALRPETAPENGYELIGDVRLNSQPHPTPIDEDINFLIQEGFQLGCPSCPQDLPYYAGLYRPLNILRSST